HEHAVRSAVFSPDGLRVITVSRDGTARVWDAATTAFLGMPFVDEDAIDGAATGSDDDDASFGWDGTARVWKGIERGPLSAWVEQAKRCEAKQTDAPGSSRVCPLAEHETTT